MTGVFILVFWGEDVETLTCFERKSAPIVALYCPVNLLEWNLFMRDVFPTPEFPRMTSLRVTFLLEGIEA